MRTACPWWAPPLLAVQFLTQIPVPATARLSADEVAVGLVRAVGWFPLVGTLIGAITAAVALAAAWRWPVYVAVPIALIFEARLTGAFHEDAVADFCDAFGGWQSREDVRRIMKDSRIGSYGSVGLILAIGLRAALTIALVAALPPWSGAAAIIGSATFGRLVVVVLMATVRPAPAGTGLAKDVGSGVGTATLLVALATALPGLMPLLLTAPLRFLAAVLVATCFVTWFRRLLLRRLGGSTGDCLGFAAYTGQLLMLAAMAAR